MKHNKLKILLVSVGSRGDMEPFLAIGAILEEKGHQVICAFPNQFEDLAKDSNLEFASLGKKFIAMLDSDIGKAVLGGDGSKFKKLVSYIKLAKYSTEANKEVLIKQHEIIENEKPDIIIYNSKAIYPVIWRIKNRGKTILVSAVPYLHYVKNHAFIGINRNLGPFLNKLTYAIANFGIITTVKISLKWLKIKDKITRKQIKSALHLTKAIYTISPCLFAGPEYWPEHIKILGYHERDKTSHWQPNKHLQEFLKQHDKILLLTFGSMTNPKPEEKTKIILDILERHSIASIINISVGGLVEPKQYNQQLFHFVKQIPYDWIFPKIYGVIHHGGSGTTHMALKYGCASLIIPHIIDQYVWNDLTSSLGVGPKGIAIQKITKEKLEPKIIDLMQHQSYKQNALQISKKIKNEDYKEELYNTIIK